MRYAVQSTGHTTVRAARRGLALMVLTGLCGQGAPAQWTQWGGSKRDFAAEATGLADKWPESGPRQIWRRELGRGHSSIVVDDGRLYTLLRRGEQDVYVSLDAKTGETLWEMAYDAPAKKGMLLDYGPGPHSTPLTVSAPTVGRASNPFAPIADAPPIPAGSAALGAREYWRRQMRWWTLGCD